MPYAVKNWQRYQHYKDRRPPWIKLHVSLLNDRRFMALAPASKCLLIMLWIVASESHDGTFTDDFDEIRYRLRWDSLVPEDISVLISSGFIHHKKADASKRKQTLADAVPEREERREREEERRDRSSQATESENDAAAATFFATIASRLKAPSPASTDDLEARRALLAEQARAIGATK